MQNVDELYEIINRDISIKLNIFIVIYILLKTIC